ncbi:MAG: FAD-dependent monooxygenase [Gordonia sp. (in: high G+C Gram-positive bacteria)]
MRVGVIGAGIGGLTVAAGLSNDGHEVMVFEQRPDPAAVGAGLTLFGNSLAALDAIGLGDRVRAVSSDAVAHLRAGQRVPSGDWLVSMPSAMVPSLRSLHRSDLHRTLADALPDAALRSGRRAEVASEGAPTVTVGGEVEGFDLVVAADGLRSRSRRRLGLDHGLHYAGYTAWRGVTAGPFDVEAAGETWGRGRIFGIVPLPRGHVYWFGTESRPAGRSDDDEKRAALDTFGDWHTPVRDCIAATPAGAVLRHDIYDLAKLPSSFVRGRTVLLGDAAHAMTPNLGQGACQAMEDAATLTLLIRSTDIDDALARYSDLRRKRTSTFWQRSRLMGRVAQASNPLAVRLRDGLLRATPPSTTAKAADRVARWTPPAGV